MPESLMDTVRLYVGDYLGDLTDELGGGGRYVKEFVSTGPKSYCYRDNSDRCVFKFKGIMKTLHNLKEVNFESMLRCINEGCVLQGVKQLIFTRDRHGRIKTTTQPKNFRMVYDKRWIHGDTKVTYPFGYHEF